MKIAIVGTGYVGLSIAMLLATLSSFAIPAFAAEEGMMTLQEFSDLKECRELVFHSEQTVFLMY